MNCYRIAGGDPQVPVGDTLQLWGRCLLRIACCHLTVIAPVTALLQCVRSPSLPPEAPRCARALAEVALCLLLFDSVYFAWHVVIHRVPWLYQRVHSTHHQNRDTFALAAQDSSPWELLSLQTIALTCAALLDCHPLSEMAFHMINIWMSVEDHCGHDLPWATHRLLPFHLLGGSPFHQTHHHHFRYNYAPYFTHWDRLCGTYRADTAEKP
ncbi:CH25H protein, partial [Amia calva]|nr:CH25H protein [Amia calva]